MYTQKETVIIDNSNMKLSYRETRNVKNGYGKLENYPYQYIIKGKLKNLLIKEQNFKTFTFVFKTLESAQKEIDKDLKILNN